MPMNIRCLTFAALCWLPCALTLADDARVTIPSFKALESTATNTVNIDIGPWLLHMAGAVLNDGDKDDAAVKTLLAGIESIQLRSFEFASDFAYPTAEIDALRRQFSTPGWTQIMQVNDRKAGEHVDIYVAMDSVKTKGLALIASDPRQLTVINIVGSIRLEDLPALERQLHIPAVKIPAVAMR